MDVFRIKRRWSVPKSCQLVPAFWRYKQNTCAFKLNGYLVWPTQYFSPQTPETEGKVRGGSVGNLLGGVGGWLVGLLSGDWLYVVLRRVWNGSRWLDCGVQAVGGDAVYQHRKITFVQCWTDSWWWGCSSTSDPVTTSRGRTTSTPTVNRRQTTAWLSRQVPYTTSTRVGSTPQGLSSG